MTQAILVGALLYVTPKILTYLCTRPDALDGRVARLREKMAYMQESLKEILGERKWYVMTDIIADNAWISYLFFAYLTHGVNPWRNMDETIKALAALVVFCGNGWLCRFGIVSIFHSLKKYVGTRSHQ